MQDKIIDNIEKNERGDSCVVKIINITSFDWDEMYVFREDCSLEEVNKQLGFKYPYFEDVARRIVFIKSRKVVYHEEESPDPDKKSKLEFILGNDTRKVIVLTRESAIFSVKRKDLFGWIYYELKPLK